MGSVAADNSEYWDFICGSSAAKMLRIKNVSPNELLRFDEWYFNFYPYLKKFLAENVPKDSSTLEVGLGYGTVSEWLGKRQQLYVGGDIANAPVELVKHRLHNCSSATVMRCDARFLPFDSQTFEAVVSIGTLHHTGDFQQSLSELVRITKPGGVIVGMVYSLLSGRNFLIQPIRTLRYAITNLSSPSHIYGDEELRALSDQNDKGIAPPSTEYFSRRALRVALTKYGSTYITATNLDELPIPKIGGILRKLMIRAGVARIFGLDLYFVLRIADNSTLNARESPPTQQ